MMGYFIGYSFRISKKHQPFPMAQPTNRINQLWNLPTKKLEKKAVCSLYVEMKQPHPMTEPTTSEKWMFRMGEVFAFDSRQATDATFSRIKKLCQGIGYMVVSSPQYGEKYSLFLQFSPWRNPRLRHFAGYPFGASRKNASATFMTQPKSCRH